MHVACGAIGGEPQPTHRNFRPSVIAPTEAGVKPLYSPGIATADQHFRSPPIQPSASRRNRGHALFLEARTSRMLVAESFLAIVSETRPICVCAAESLGDFSSCVLLLWHEHSTLRRCLVAFQPNLGPSGGARDAASVAVAANRTPLHRDFRPAIISDQSSSKRQRQDESFLHNSLAIMPLTSERHTQGCTGRVPFRRINVCHTTEIDIATY